jgi:hypothetical protein
MTVCNMISKNGNSRLKKIIPNIQRMFGIYKEDIKCL